jgi:hypothetical protein
MTENNDIITKIQKVLALASNNPSEEEGQTAMLLAQKIMIENNLTMSDVVSEIKTKEVINEPIFEAQKTSWWQHNLSSIIAENFMCAIYVNRNKYYKKTTFRFVGIKSDVETAKHVYLYAVKIITNNCENYIRNYINKHPKTSIKGVSNQYIWGFLQGLKDKFKEQIKNNSWGLVVVKDPIVDEEFSKLKIKNGSIRNVRTNGNKEDEINGYRDGKNFIMISGELN